MPEPVVSLSRTTGRVPKAAHLLADDLRRQILTQRLSVGTPLPGERQLIEQSGYSRATVREALRQLESEGLITTQRGPRGGLSVAHPDTHHVTRSLAVTLALSDANLRDLFEFREVLEPPAAAMAAERATAPQREALLAEADRYPDSQIVHNADFHLCLAAATNNEFYRLALAAVLEITVWHSVEDRLTDDELLSAVRAHQRIARHIVERRPDAARDSMYTHLRGFRALMEARGRLKDSIIVRHESNSRVHGRAESG